MEQKKNNININEKDKKMLFGAIALLIFLIILIIILATVGSPKTTTISEELAKTSSSDIQEIEKKPIYCIYNNSLIGMYSIYSKWESKENNYSFNYKNLLTNEAFINAYVQDNAARSISCVLNSGDTSSFTTDNELVEFIKENSTFSNSKYTFSLPLDFDKSKNDLSSIKSDFNKVYFGTSDEKYELYSTANFTPNIISASSNASFKASQMINKIKETLISLGASQNVEIELVSEFDADINRDINDEKIIFIQSKGNKDGNFDAFTSNNCGFSAIYIVNGEKLTSIYSSYAIANEKVQNESGEAIEDSNEVFNNLERITDVKFVDINNDGYYECFFTTENDQKEEMYLYQFNKNSGTYAKVTSNVLYK